MSAKSKHTFKKYSKVCVRRLESLESTTTYDKRKEGIVFVNVKTIFFLVFSLAVIYSIQTIQT